ncbi:MAG TPA: phosphoribosylformylglycinamidine synthase subunit PurS [Ktedonobacterales bacterium]|jgi:phosphoribosylformylglycinamidine synthase
MTFCAQIHVTLKPSVFDPQGATVVRALGTLGFDEVADVRVGKYLEVRLTAHDEATARQRVSGMCETLLTNPVIERYEFTLAQEEA